MLFGVPDRDKDHLGTINGIEVDPRNRVISNGGYLSNIRRNFHPDWMEHKNMLETVFDQAINQVLNAG